MAWKDIAASVYAADETLYGPTNPDGTDGFGKVCDKNFEFLKTALTVDAYWDDADPTTFQWLKLTLKGSASGTLQLKPPAAAGSSILTFPAGTTDFSATGGASQVVKQVSAGAPFTVGAVADAELALTDVTTNDALTTKHGFLKKLSNIATEFMNGQGAWATPAGGMQYADARFEILTGTKNLADADTTQAFTGANFAPKAALFIGTLDGTNVFSIAFAENVGTAEGRGIFTASATAGIFSYQGTAFSLYKSAVPDRNIASISSWDSDGLTLSWVKTGSPTGTADLHILCLR